MENSLIKALSVLQLEAKEIKFFLASFELGPALIHQVAAAAKLKRSTGYLIAEQLIAKGLLIEDLKSYKKNVYAISPEQLIQKITARQRLLRRQELALTQLLPELQHQYQQAEFKPQVKVMLGSPGLLRGWQDILTTKKMIRLWTNQETEKNFFTPGQHRQFIHQRLANQLPIRVLAVNNSSGRELATTDQKSLRQTKLLPPAVQFETETYLYDQRIAIFDFRHEIMTVLIQSPAIASAQQAIFDFSWQQQTATSATTWPIIR